MKLIGCQHLCVCVDWGAEVISIYDFFLMFYGAGRVAF